MALRFLPAAVPDYGRVPQGVTSSDILRRLEGKPAVSSPVQLPRSMYLGGKSGASNSGEEFQETPVQQPAPPPPPQQDPIAAAVNAIKDGGSAVFGGMLGGSGASAGAGAEAGGGLVPVGSAMPGAEGLYSASTVAPELGAMPAGSVAGPVAGALFAAHRANRMYGHLNDPGKGVGEGIKEGFKPANMLAFGIGGAPLVGGAMGLVNDAFGSGKDQDQLTRDAQRRQMQADGLVDENYSMGGYDVGGDGSNRTYQVANAEDPVTGRVVGIAQVISGIYTGKPGSKEATDMTGWLTNMAMQNSGGNYEAAMGALLEQFSKIAEQRNLTPQATRDILKKWKDEGLIDEPTYQAYAVAHESLVDGNPWQFDNETAKAPNPGAPQPAQAPAPAEGPSKIMVGNKQPPPNSPVPQRIPVTMPASKPAQGQAFRGRNPRLSMLTAYAPPGK